nr:MAG TPA: hypothetical protein [Caudoviricetes sp.]
MAIIVLVTIGTLAIILSSFLACLIVVLAH